MASHRKASVGDPLAIQAAEFNGWQRAAAFVEGFDRSYRRSASLSLRNSGVVLIRNESGNPVDRFGILEIGGPVINPDENLDRFAEQVVLKGIVPYDNAGAFAVLIEPLRPNAVGRATVDGVCIARVEMDSEDDTLADIKPNSTTELRSTAYGSARILWAGAPIDDISLCVIRIGSQSASAGLIRPFIVTRVFAAGNSYGESDTQLDIDTYLGPILAGTTSHRIFPCFYHVREWDPRTGDPFGETYLGRNLAEKYWDDFVPPNAGYLSLRPNKPDDIVHGLVYDAAGIDPNTDFRHVLFESFRLHHFRYCQG